MAKHKDFHTEVLLRGEESGGRIALVENTVAANWEGPPLHHHDFDEAFCVLEGELTFQVGEELTTAPAGTLAFAPRDAHHTLANLSGAAARYLLVCTPAGFERYFDKLAAEQAGVGPPPEALGPIPETTVVGPQIGDGGHAGEAARLSPERARINVLLRSRDSADQVAVMDNSVGPGGGPPLHHHAFDEAFYVIDGELTFQLGDELVTRRAGELAFAPGGVHHAFANLSGADARTLLVCTPAGFERYFQRIAAKAAGVDPPPEALEPWPESVTVGPRIGERQASGG